MNSLNIAAAPGTDAPAASMPGVHVLGVVAGSASADYRPLTASELATYPWRCIGRLEAQPPGSTGWFHAGTAALVGPKMIITASHCFKNRSKADGWDFRFTPAYSNGQQATDPDGGHHTRTGLTGEMVLGRPGHTGGGGVWDTVAGWDFAICELHVPLGDFWGHLGVYAGAKNAYDDIKWASVGYPVGLEGGNRPYLFPGIDIHDIEEDKNNSFEIETDDYVLWKISNPDFADGWSGGPLLAIRQGTWVVAGVMSGTEPDGLDTDGTNVFAGGPRLLQAHQQAHQAWSTFDWSGWFPVGGTFHTGDTVAVVARRPDSFEVFGRAPDGSLWQNDYPAATTNGWTGWHPTAPGAVASGPPTAVSWSADHVSLFFVGTDGQAWTCNWYDSTGWSGMFPLGGSFAPGESLAALARRPGSFELFGRGLDGSLWQNDFPAATTDGWTGWHPTAPGAVASGPPTAVSWSPDHVSLFFVGTDGQAWTCNWYDSTGWSGMFPLGGGFGAGESLAAIARTKGTFELFGRGNDHRLWQNDYPAATTDGWTGWVPTAPGLSPSASPAALSHHPDTVQVFALDNQSALFTTHWGNLDS